MVAAAGKLTLEEFERLYPDGVKPYYEYWFGEAVPKAMATVQHGFVQKIAMRLLDQAGYRSASEVKLKLSRDFEPLPDVIAKKVRFERPYPTTPFDVVLEILSPEDSFNHVVKKCRIYSDWGIPNVL